MFLTCVSKSCVFSLSVSKPKPTAGKRYYLAMQVANNAGVRVLLIPNDNRPPEGFHINPNTVFTITKETGTNKPVTFIAVDEETLEKLEINKQQNVSITPVDKPSSPGKSLSITSKSRFIHLWVLTRRRTLAVVRAMFQLVFVYARLCTWNILQCKNMTVYLLVCIWGIRM